MIERLKLFIDKLKAKFKKDSTTSDKPPSSQPFHKPVSLREKSGKRPGGQLGHPGNGLKLFENPTNIIEKTPKLCDKCGGMIDLSDNYSARQLVDVKLVVNIDEERIRDGICKCCGNIVKGEFSDGFNNPVQYGNNLKALVALISEHGCVSISRTAEIVNSISEGVLSISGGTVFNFQRELSKKLEITINRIRETLCEASVLNADETGCRVNGSLKWIQVFCNERLALFTTNSKRGDIDANLNILTYFMGILVHDHFSSYYKYDHLDHAECNEHILRYLKSLIEIFKHNWAQEMSALLKRACHEKNELLRAGMTEMPADQILEFSERYDAIIKSGRLEYTNATQGNKKRESYYADERRLLTRLEEYKKEHLFFLNDFRAPFSNNMAERGCRVYKMKMKVSGCFRSDEGAIIYSRILSLIVTLKKQDKNIFDGIRSVYSGCVPISTA